LDEIRKSTLRITANQSLTGSPSLLTVQVGSWIAAMQPRSPATQRWANLITTVDSAYAGQALGLGIIGTAGFSAAGGLASHIGDTQPIGTQEVGNVGAKAGTSAINRAIEGLAGGEALGPYSLLPDIAGDYILEYGTAYSTPPTTMTYKYRPNATRLLAVLALILLGGFLSNPIRHWPLSRYQMLYLVLALGICTLLYLSQRLYTYFEIVTKERGKVLIRRQGLFLKTCPVDAIYAIGASNWVIPVFLIKYKVGNSSGALSLTPSGYDSEVVAKLISNLRSANASIQLDDHVKKYLARVTHKLRSRDENAANSDQ
jgi:hypothetical protein